jgi:hypothetical protein
MGNFRFYRRLHILPGLSVNISKSGPSLSVGVRGAHVTVGPKGIRRTVGIPGSGLYYTSHTGYHSGVHSRHVEDPISPTAQGCADTIVGLLVVVGLLTLVVWIVSRLL